MRTEVRRLLQQPWPLFVVGTRERVLQRPATGEARWQAKRNANVARDAALAREIRKVLGGWKRIRTQLASRRSLDQVRVFAQMFEGAEDDWGGEALQRKVWIRYWGLTPGSPGAMPLSKPAACAAIQWVVDSYPGWLHAASLPWEERLAALGSVEAAQHLAWACSERLKTGRSRLRDRAAALRWYKRAFELGDTSSATNVGFAYFYGKGVRRDRQVAAQWYRKAALGRGVRSRDEATRMDSAAAMANLGRMYHKGQGVRQSWPAAIRWFTRAARLGHRDGQNFLWKIYDGDEGLPPRHALALRWLRKAAAKGDVDAVVCLGVHLWNGKHTRRNRPRAMRLYAQGAEKGNGWGMYLLGLAYREIPAPRRDLKLSRRWLRRAASRGLKEARRALKAHPTRRARSAVAPPA